MAQTWPLTGRDAELARMAGMLRGTGGGVLLAGEAGVGKSRLAREAVAAAVRRGARGRWVAATSSAAGLPLGCFAHLLSGGGGRGDPGTVLRRVLDALGCGPGGAGAVLCVDDAHLLDDASAVLVQQLAASGLVRLVLTLRTGEPAPDAVTALWKDGPVRRVEVGPLSARETEELVEATLGGPVESAAVARLWRLTRGNVLYLQQVVDGERDAGRLRNDSGTWSWTGEARLAPRLVELLGLRIGVLDEGVGRVLELLALGEPLQVSTLTGLAGRDAIERAEQRGLVVLGAAGEEEAVRLSHPLFGEVVRARTGVLRARRLRGELAGALAAAGEADPLRLAVLTVDGDRPADAGLLTRAAGQAADHLDLALAERLARAAGERFGAALVLGWVATLRGDAAAARTAFDTAARLGEHDGHRTKVATHRATSLHFVHRRADAADEVLVRALDEVEDPAATAELTAFRGYLHCCGGRLDSAERLARSVLSDHPDRARCIAAITLVGVLAVSGRLDQLSGLVELGAAHLEPRRVAAALRVTLGDRVVAAHVIAGRLAEADRAARLHDVPTVAGVPVPGAFAGMHGQVALARGDVRAAVRLLRAAAGGTAFRDPGGWDNRSRIQLVQALATAGRVAEARVAIGEVEATLGPHTAYFAPDAALAGAWLSAAEGVIGEARSRARTAADAAQVGGQPAVEVQAWETAVRFGDRTAARRLAELADRVDGPRAAIAAAHAAALAGADGAGLGAAADRWEGIGALLHAADAHAQAALVFSDSGRPGAAASAAARARHLAGRCPGAATPASGAAARPLPLTPREREVATLAARGSGNREIAERLVLSVRTVEGHLLRACAKLGVTRRSGLAPLLLDLPEDPAGR